MPNGSCSLQPPRACESRKRLEGHDNPIRQWALRPASTQGARNLRRLCRQVAASCQPNRQARSQDRRFDRGSRAPHRLEERHDRLVPPRFSRGRQDHQHGGRHPRAHGLQGPDARLVVAAILQLRSDRAHQVRPHPPHLFLGNARQARRGDLQRPDGRADQHPLPRRPCRADPERRDRHRRRLPGRLRLRSVRQRQWRLGALALRFARLRHGRRALRAQCRDADRGDRPLPEYAGVDPSGSGRLDRQGRSGGRSLEDFRRRGARHDEPARSF